MNFLVYLYNKISVTMWVNILYSRLKVVVSVAIDIWHVTLIRTFGSNPCPRRRVGCALVGSEILICGGAKVGFEILECGGAKVEHKGKMKEILHYHSDVYILHLSEWLFCCQECTYVVIVVFPSPS